eukprot:scaffold100057_cov72-Phaeocystis_antarctica.AAC.2
MTRFAGVQTFALAISSGPIRLRTSPGRSAAGAPFRIELSGMMYTEKRMGHQINCSMAMAPATRSAGGLTGASSSSAKPYQHDHAMPLPKPVPANRATLPSDTSSVSSSMVCARTSPAAKKKLLVAAFVRSGAV